MIEKQIIKLLLRKDFYEKHKGKVSKSMFTNGTGSFYNSIEKAHTEYDTDLTLDELETLHVDKYNPALTRTAKNNFELLLDEIRKEPDPKDEIISDIVSAIHKRNVAHKIALIATDIYNGKDDGFNDIKNLLETEEEEPVDDTSVTKDITELMKLVNVTTKWKFNLPTLAERITGIGEGNLSIIFARPETGKTAFWISLVASKGGFASQGAKIHALINEEPAVRTQMRLINAWTGYDRDEIQENIDVATEKWAEIRQNIKLFDTVDWTIDDIDSHLATHKPDILIIDQLDKVNIGGNFARNDEKLRAIYTGARELAKRRNCSVIAISQASADAHNKLELSFDMMENSKTGKAAEADLIIGVGKRNDLGEATERSLCLSKNKITGWHGTIHCNIDDRLSRYVV
mgnify:FL=1